MRRNQLTIVSLMSVCLLWGLSAFGAAGDKAEVKGMIISRTGETVIVSASDGKTTVVLDDDTKVQHPRGLGLRKRQVSAAVLVPGLKVKVNGTSDDQGRILAKTITFDSNDLETAEMIQAGLHPTKEQVAANQVQLAAQKEDISANQQAIGANQQAIGANQQNIAANAANIEQNVKDIEENTNRFNQLSEYDVKGDLTVNFKSGSAKISPDDEGKLKQLAQDATKLTGYLIEVRGFADATGSAAMNTALSQDRAQAVIDYLIQQGGIPVRHVVAPGAYGETNAVASNETKSGRAENRRVEVKVLVNKGITGS